MAHERTARLSASPRLFQNRLLDLFSRIHPSVPAIVFLPVTVAGVWLGVDRGYGAVQILLLVALGLFIWTLTEYWLHRLVFHWEPDHPVGSRLHFIIHGVHHDHPNDRLRLVMPPAASLTSRANDEGVVRPSHVRVAIQFAGGYTEPHLTTEEAALDGRAS